MMVVEARQELMSSRQIAITQLHMEAVETTYWKRETCDKTFMHGGGTANSSLSYSTRHFNSIFYRYSTFCVLCCVEYE